MPPSVGRYAYLDELHANQRALRKRIGELESGRNYLPAKEQKAAGRELRALRRELADAEEEEAMVRKLAVGATAAAGAAELVQGAVDDYFDGAARTIVQVALRSRSGGGTCMHAGVT